MRSQQELRELPKEFTDAMNDLNNLLEKVPVKIRRVIAVAQKYEIDRRLVRSLLKQALENVLSERSIDRYLQEAKTRQKAIEPSPAKEISKQPGALVQPAATAKMADIAANNLPEEIIDILCPDCKRKVVEKLGL